jgi:hypothetical protein
LIGSSRLRAHFQIVKRHGLPTRGIGRGLYELLRLSSQETVGQAPSKAQVDAWVRGLYFYALTLSSPLGRTRALSTISELTYRELYQGPACNLPAVIDEALDRARTLLERLETFIQRGRFTPRACARFLEAFPEGATRACVA